MDRTSNWPITVVAALLLTLSTPSSHHGVILFGMLIVSLLLLIEGRRYRFRRERSEVFFEGSVSPWEAQEVL